MIYTSVAVETKKLKKKKIKFRKYHTSHIGKKFCRTIKV